MIKLNILFDATAEETPRFPVYAHYVGQCQPQPAYLELDCLTGELDADYSGEIGNAVPVSIWNNLVLRFPIWYSSHRNEIADTIEDNKEHFQAILDGFAEVWDGNNYVGSFTESATEIIDSLNLMRFESDYVMLDAQSLPDWMDGNLFCDEHQTLDDFVQEILACDGNDGYCFADDLLDADEMKSQILNLWANHLYCGYPVPKHAAQILIANKTCDDSEWMDELTAYAEGLNPSEDS